MKEFGDNTVTSGSINGGAKGFLNCTHTLLKQAVIVYVCVITPPGVITASLMCLVYSEGQPPQTCPAFLWLLKLQRQEAD